ncbi:MAG: right-handed parallel beta-helix repeat-containing protein [Limisphaerales bacterium]
MSPCLFRFAALTVRLASAAMPAPAAVWHVRPEGDDAADGRTWATALATIAAGATNAVAGDEVWIAAGTYSNTVALKPGTSLLGGFAGGEASAAEARPDLRPAVLDGGMARALLRVTGSNTNVITRLQGLVFSRGLQQGDGSRGVVDVPGGRTEIRDCRFLNNNNSWQAGASALRVSGGYLLLERCTFQGNQAATGGAAYIINLRSAEVRGCKFQGNKASRCGALSINLSSAHVADCEFIGNRILDPGGVGGAVEVFESDVRLSRSRLIANQAPAAAALVEVRSSARPPSLYANNLFLHNIATGPEIGSTFPPAAIYSQGGRSSFINNSFLHNHGSPAAGTVIVTLTGTNPVTVANNLFLGPGPFLGRSGSGAPAACTHNLFWPLRGGTGVAEEQLATSGNRVADPRLPGDFPALMAGLPPDSLAVNAGSDDHAALAGELDFNGQLRRQGGRVDIGAHESTGQPVGAPAARIMRVRPDGDDAADGSTWAAARRTVAGALAAADFQHPLEVWLAAGTYTGEHRVPPFSTLRGGFAGTETNAADRPSAGAASILDAQGTNAVLELSATADTVAVERVTVVGGANSNGSLAPVEGTGTLARFTDCEFRDTARSVGGAAVRLLGAPEFWHCRFRDNRAPRTAALSLTVRSGEARIQGCLFESNTVASGSSSAGGLALQLSGRAEVAHCVFRGNQPAAGNDRSVFRAHGLDGGQPVVHHCTFVGNGSADPNAPGLALLFTNTAAFDPRAWANMFVSNGVALRVLTTGSSAGLTNNLFFSNGADAQGLLNQAQHPPASHTFDPLLAPDGFRLLPGSTARDLGGPAGGVDFDGQPRWQGASSDLGAVEQPAANAEHAALARLDWRVQLVGDLAYLRYAGVLSNSCAVSLAGTVSNGVVHVTPLVPPGSPPCDEPAVLNGRLPLGGWRPELGALPVALDGQVATGVVTPPQSGPLPPALRLLPGAPNLRATVLGLPGITYTLERTEDFVRWEPVAELHDTAPAGDPDEPVSLEHSLPPAGTNGVLRLRM